MTRRALGARVRTARRHRRWTQGQLASKAGVSQSLVSIVELGQRGASLESIERIAAASGSTARVAANASDGADESGDAAHARCVGAVVRVLESHGLACAIEQPATVAGRPGWIDVLAWATSSRLLIVIEVKVDPRQVGGLVRQVETYARGCVGPAAELGWRPQKVFVVLVLLATAAADAFAIANREALRSAFPTRGERVLGTLFGGVPPTGRGMVMVDPRRRGRRAFLTLRVDGRRTEAPYLDGPDFLSRVSDR